MTTKPYWAFSDEELARAEGYGKSAAALTKETDPQGFARSLGSQLATFAKALREAIAERRVDVAVRRALVGLARHRGATLAEIDHVIQAARAGVET